MLQFVYNTFFWTFAIYGLFEFFRHILQLKICTNFKAEGIYVIVAVKNQEKIIEGFLRSVLFKILYGREEFFENVLVVDLKSNDSTKDIIKKLSTDYGVLKVITWNDCKEIIDNIEDL